jgi:hypothetical protein
MKKAEKQAEMKRCTKCGKLKGKSEFSKHSGRTDGLRCWCKKCECGCMHEYYRRNKKSVKKYYSYEECHRVVDGVKEKQCRRCRKWKELIDYHKNAPAKDGVSVLCKKCISNSRKRRLAVRN